MNPQNVPMMIPIAPTRNRRRNNICSKNRKWTPEEDQLLHQIASESDTVNWKAAESQFPGKTSQQIVERWTKVLNPKLQKGSWTRQEDEIIINFVRNYGLKSWTKLANLLPGRIGKQCRERWLNNLDPGLTRQPWTPEEDLQLFLLHEQFGNHWSKISMVMPSRADNMCKNRWYSSLSKKTKEEIEEAARNYKGTTQNIQILAQPADTQAVILDSPTAPSIPGNLTAIEHVNDMNRIQTGFTPMKVKFDGPTPYQQQENLPRPQLFEEIPMDTPSIWTPSIGTGQFSGTPVGFISPMMPSASPFALLSPYKKMASIFSPWAQDPPSKTTNFMSPMRQKHSPPSLSENRAELMNLIVHQ